MTVLRIRTLVGMLVFLVPLPLFAATLFVDIQNSNCSDGHSYSQAQNESTPLCTLPKSSSLVNPGDTVRVRAGTYTLSTTWSIDRGGNSSSRVTFQTYGNGPVIIKGASATDIEGVHISADYVTFEGFEIQGSGDTGLNSNGNNVTLRWNRIHDNGRGCSTSTKCGQGIASNQGRADVIIENNLSYRNGSGVNLDHCYYISGQRIIIRNNIAWDCAGFGFQVYPNCDNCEVYNNVSYGMKVKSGFLLGGEGSTSANMKVYNNISAQNAKYGFDLWNNGSDGIDLRNNIAFDNGQGPLRVTNTTNYSVTGMIEQDPRFVNPAQMDWHILSGSPAIDAGTNLLVAPFDIDRQARPAGLAVDIGADEFAGTGDTTPPAAPANARRSDRH